MVLHEFGDFFKRPNFQYELSRVTSLTNYQDYTVVVVLAKTTQKTCWTLMFFPQIRGTTRVETKQRVEFILHR